MYFQLKQRSASIISSLLRIEPVHVARQWIDRIYLMDRIARERMELSELSEEQLRDIGIHRAFAEQEAARSCFDLPKNRLSK